MGTNQYGFIFDNIGNRESYANNSGVSTYTANPLNQYTQIVEGVALSTPSFDLDGNLLTHDGWTYAWNGENRMVQASNATTVVSFAYDYMGRRFSKTTNSVTTTFIYDGWNLVQENSSAATNNYVWGLDLSQSLQGAGGVGGLLCVVQNGDLYFPLYDGNGNICEYIDQSGTVVAHREYSPFGETIALTGSKKDDFNFWFSTHYLDDETGLYNAKNRYYSPTLGRYLSKDPIAEIGSIAASSPEAKRKLMKRVIEILSARLNSAGFTADEMAPIVDAVRRAGAEQILMRARMDPLSYAEEIQNLYGYVQNDPLNTFDPFGLKKKKTKKELVDAAKAAWEAAKYAVPGSEFAAAFEIFGGCNSLGLANSWAQRQLNTCLCKKDFDHADCKAWQVKVNILTETWNKLCDKNKKKKKK